MIACFFSSLSSKKLSLLFLLDRLQQQQRLLFFNALTFPFFLPRKMENSKPKPFPTKQPPRFLLFGGTGWIGGLVSELLTKEGAVWKASKARLEDRALILKEIEEVRLEEIAKLKKKKNDGDDDGGGGGERRNSTPNLFKLNQKPTNQQFKPTHVLNAAGLTGRPNVDWCETHKVRRRRRRRRRRRKKKWKKKREF